MTGSVALLLVRVAQAGCMEDLELALQGVESRFAFGEVVALDEALRGARQALACVEAPIASDTAARLHRAEALAAWSHGDVGRADQHLAGLVGAAPLLRLDPIVPADHALEARLLAIEESPVAPSRWLPWPSRGALLVDGIATAAAPTDRPWVFQLVEGARASSTAWVDVGAAPPPYPVADAGSAPRSGRGRGWKWAGLATGVAAGALYGGAWVANAGYHDAVEAADNDAIARSHGTTNGLAIGSTAAAGASAALLVVGFTR